MLPVLLVAEADAVNVLQQVPWTEGLLAAFLGFLVFVLREARPLVTAWVSSLIDRIQNDTIRTKVKLARAALATGADSVSQTLVPKLREANADGKITDEERADLLATARQAGMDAFSQEWWDDFMERMELTPEGLVKWANNEVEARVFRMKMKREGADVDPDDDGDGGGE